jgi:hypothetical protein
MHLSPETILKFYGFLVGVLTMRFEVSLRKNLNSHLNNVLESAEGKQQNLQ